MLENRLSNRWLITLAVMLPTLIEIIDTSVVNVSLNHIRGSLSAGVDEATWSITSYLVSNAIIIPMTGWLSRLMGRKRYLMSSIALFTVSSFFCGSAWNLQSLIFFRVLQGIGGGGLQPLSQAILLETYPPKEQGMAMAFFGMGIMFGPIIGPLLGGWITDNWSWHWIFYINIPIGIISLFMVWFFIQDPHYMRKIRMKIDYWGLGLLAVGLGCLQVVLDKGQGENWFSSSFILWFFVAAVVCLTFFLILERYSQQPIVNLRIFRNVSFSTGNLVMFFVFFNLFASIVLLPIFLQTLMGYTATLAGLLLGPGGFATLISMPLAGRLVNRVNPKGMLAFGILVCAYATFLMSRFTLDAGFSTLVWPRVVLGFGMGFIFIPLTTLTMGTIRKEELGNATSIFNLLRNLGGSFGVAFVTTVLARRAQFHQLRLAEHLNPLDPGFRIGADAASTALAHQGISGQLGGYALILRQTMRQASMMSFNDAFHVLSVIAILILPLVLLLKRTTHDSDAVVH